MDAAINNVITGLNSVGQSFSNYAADIFLQSSVLIILLLAADFLLRKRVRAVFRYCVWMLVFVKLVLPTSFALPTGIGYWLGDFSSVEYSAGEAMPVVEERGPVMMPQEQAEPVRREAVVFEPPTYETFPVVAGEAAPIEPVTSTANTGAPPVEIQLEAISWQGFVFLGWLVGMLVLSVLLVQRAFFVKGLLAQAQEGDGRLRDLLRLCHDDVGVRVEVGLRVSDTMSSPAVCGLLRPTILLPRYLVEQLSEEKLRAVLLHECAHIKRWDLWVNLVQTVLQIVYFYNPFVWLANARVRRVREQAVDETVLVALGGRSESYSDVLIDIGEMAFWRPNFSLRLIGVVESKKALAARIKHIAGRPIPKTAKLGIVGSIAVILIAAVLLPMARAQRADVGVEAVRENSQAQVKRLVNEAQDYFARLAKAQKGKDWGEAERWAERLRDVFGEFKSAITVNELRARLENLSELTRGQEKKLRELESLKQAIEACASDREQLRELGRLIHNLEDLSDDLHAVIRDDKMYMLTAICDELNRQWRNFRAIVRFKYLITDVSGLQTMNNDLNGSYILECDIDASDTRHWNEGAGFKPIGSDTEPFTGRFDGRGHRVTQLYINRPLTDGVGLFGYIKDGAVVQNVGLPEVDITARRNSGPLVGSSSGSMVCYSWSTGSIRGSHDYQMRLGGLIGISCGANSHVYQCFSSVNVTATGGAHQVGGLAGYNGHGSIMTDCYATGNVSGTWKVGGLVGDNLYPEGGFVKRCYSIGKVSGRGGGLVGFNWRGGITEDSYWDTQTSGKTSSYGGTGKTTREMLQQSTFENWDFDETWDIKEGESYPFLILKRREIRRPQIMTEGAGPKLTEAMRGLVAYWKFDEGSGNTAYDSAGNNNGTIHGAKWTKGTVGGALSFDGKDNYVMIPDSDVFDFGKGNFSISTWFKTVSMSDQFIIGFRGSTKCIEMYVNSASHVGSYIDTGSETIRLPFINTKYNDGKWHHAAITLDNGVGNGYRLFLDGIMVGALTCSADFSDWSHIAIGGNPKGTWNKHFFNGQIDEIAIYNQALSAEKVQQLYQSRAAIYQEPSASSGPIAHWKFDEGSGTAAHDSAGGHRGVVRGAAWTVGKVGTGLGFDGIDDVVAAAMNVDQSSSSRGATFCAWVYPTSISEGRHHVISSDNRGYDWSLLRQADIWCVFTGEGSRSAGFGVDLFTWQHVTAVFVPGIGVKFYKNGTEFTIPHIDYDDSDNDIAIGGSPARREEFFAGVIDEVMIFDRPLTAREVEQVYLSAEEIKRPSRGISRGPERRTSSGWVDILESIDVERDARGGDWRCEDGTLIGFAQSTLETSYELPAEYDVLWEFESNSTAINLLLASPLGKRFEWMMKGWSHRLCGIREVGCQPVNANETTTAFPLESGVRYVAEVKVRKDRFVALINGEEILNYKTDWSDIEVCLPWHPFELQGRRLGLWLNKHWTKTYRLKVRPHNGDRGVADNLIVPGTRVGNYAIGISKDDVLKSLGKPNVIFYRQEKYTLDNLPKEYFMVYDDISFGLVDDSVEGVSALSPLYKFANGLGVGDSEQKIKQAFGDNYHFKETEGKDFLTYEDEGIQFEIHKYNRTVMEISVFRKTRQRDAGPDGTVLLSDVEAVTKSQVPKAGIEASREVVGRSENSGAAKSAGDTGYRVTGRVLTEPGGQAVAGVTVTLWHGGDGKTRTTVTREDGSYEFGGVKPSQYKYVLRTEKRPGIWTDWVIIYVGQQDVENTDVYLSLPQSVSGVVRDAQTGEPVAGADIRVSTDEGRNGDGMETDAEGRFVLYVAPRDVTVDCSGTRDRYYTLDESGRQVEESEKKMTVKAGESIENVDFEVRSAAEFRGEVTYDTGRGAPDIDVYVQVNWSGGRDVPASLPEAFGFGRTFRLKADEQGRFVGYLRRPQGTGNWHPKIDLKAVARLADGSMGGVAHAQTNMRTPDVEGMTAWPDEDAANAGAEPETVSRAGAIERVHIVLAKSGSAVIKVVDPNGEAIDNAEVTASDIQAEFNTHFGGPVEYLGDGRYRMTNLIPGLEYHMSANAAGYRRARPREKKFTLAPGHEHDAGKLELRWWGSKAVPGMVKQLASADRYDREGAARSLGELGADAAEAVPALIESLRSDPRHTVRGAAAAALGKIGPAAEQAVPDLIAALEHDDGAGMKGVAAIAIVRIGDPEELGALPALTEYGAESLARGMEHHPEPKLCPSKEFQIRVAETLGRIGPAAQGAVRRFKRSLVNDPDSEVRAAVARALGQIGGEAALKALEGSQGDYDREVRRAVTEAIKRIRKNDSLRSEEPGAAATRAAPN